VIKGWWGRWPNAAVAVATGQASGVCVLDVDRKPAGPNGFDTLEELGLSPLPDTPISHTPSGGIHLFFDPRGREIPSSVGKIGAGLDVRGDRASCVAPTPGAAYRWDPLKNLRTVPLAPAPERLIPSAPPAPQTPPPRPTAGELTPYGAAAVNGAVRAIYNAPAGQQAITLNRDAFGIGQLAGAGVVPERIALDALLCGALAMPSYDRRRPWRRGDVERSVRRSFEAGMRSPRDGR
jgi:hypothetical protein